QKRLTWLKKRTIPRARGVLKTMPSVSSWHGGVEPKLQVQNTKLEPRLAGPRADTRSVSDVGAAARLPDRSRGRQKAGPTTARRGRKAAPRARAGLKTRPSVSR